ncbi:hypothetical protein BXY58_2137 [Epilithonimonas arachidiradicis]|uniref:Uncharacterized protein n=1 Tax=Epilithonimonas arachidiradicis TaxID=1617282 RepID=A0A420D9K3_9FLAO|nr:hypothetical protein BXY58_2137 [Epilithonimonas arachidiradicis]
MKNTIKTRTSNNHDKTQKTEIKQNRKIHQAFSKTY